ncbi:MAG TPA: hypothetical protein VFY31_01360 [Macromonas sp.]|nr:hypothetical protein [Macromonas sp.]
MLKISKADLVIEPMAFILELLARLLGRVVFRSVPDSATEPWGLSEWLWLTMALCLLLVVVWAIARHFKER